jgi:hypothetical protein
MILRSLSSAKTCRSKKSLCWLPLATQSQHHTSDYQASQRLRADEVIR